MPGQEETLPSHIEDISEYKARNLFNTNECGIFYKLAPEWSIVQQRPMDGRYLRNGSLCLCVLTTTEQKSLSQSLFNLHGDPGRFA